MGRHAQGWKIQPRGKYYWVRFRHKGEQYNLSTGQTDSARAATEAAAIYSGVVDGKSRTVRVTARSLSSLDVLVADWIASIEGVLDEETVATYQGYASKHWLDRWERIGEVAHDGAVADYARERLRVVLAKTVRKELSALFGFFEWCEEKGHIAEVPKRPKIRKTVKGHRSGPQREKAPEYAPHEIEAALAALPEWSRVRRGEPPFSIRGRFVVAYETGLRPATLDALFWGDLSGDYSSLAIRDEVDKARFGRVVPLTPRARRVFATLARRGVEDDQIIFGRHDYRSSLKLAATLAGLRSLSPYDFRHARGTHMAEAGASLAGIAYMLGHKHMTTTSKYLHPSLRAAEQALLVAGTPRPAMLPNSRPETGADDDLGAIREQSWGET